MLTKNNLQFGLLTIWFIFVFSCEKSLQTLGLAQYKSIAYVNSNSDIKIFSYKNATPDFLTSVEPTDSKTISIPVSIIKPAFDFGEPVNPYLYVNRDNESKPYPLDIIIKIYNKNSDSEDFYFEAPVLGPTVTPSNVTTAMSWILRWSFNNQILSLSKKNFDLLISKVEVICENCREKTTTEIVSLILQNTNLISSIKSIVESDNSEITVPSLSYNPPDLDYAWSNPTVGTNWQIVLSLEEPTEISETVNSINNINKQNSLSVDAVAVNPKSSDEQIKPDLWSHQSQFIDTQSLASDAIAQLSSIADTPLIYSFDFSSSGLHTFTSQMSSGASFPLTVKATILDHNILPICKNNETAMNIIVNRLFTYNVDLTPTIQVRDNNGLITTRVKSSNLAIKDLSKISDQINNSLAKTVYSIVFTVNASSTTYSINKSTNLYTNQPVTLANSSTSDIFNSNSLISFDDLSIYLSGTPLNGDQITIQIPGNNFYHNKLTDAFGNYLFNQVAGCFDIDLTTESQLSFSVNNAPSGFTVSPNGDIRWGPTVSNYSDFQNGTIEGFEDNKIVAKINVTDVSGVTRILKLKLNLQEDTLPKLYVNYYDANSNLVSAVITSNSIDYNDPNSIRAHTFPITVDDSAYPELFAVSDFVFSDLTPQPFIILDEDGDPTSLAVPSEISPSLTTVQSYPGYPASGTVSTYSINRADINATFNSSTSLNLISSSTTTSIYSWDFIPSAQQILSNLQPTSALAAYTLVPVRLSVYYSNDGLPFQLYQTSAPAATFEILLKVKNTLDNPASTLAINNGARCSDFQNPPTYSNCINSSTLSDYVPTLKVIDEVNSSTQLNATTSNMLSSGEISSEEVTKYGGASNLLVASEGGYATLELPIAFNSSKGPGLPAPYDSIFPLIYTVELTDSYKNSNCASIFMPSRIFFQQTSCTTNSSDNCIKLKLNYNYVTKAQDPLPYFLPSKCEFTVISREANALTAITPDPLVYPQQTTYTLYIANQNRSATMVAYNNSNQKPIFQVPEIYEGVTVDLSESLYHMIQDADLGAYNLQNPVSIVSGTQVKNANNFYQDIFEVTNWAPEMRIVLDSTNTIKHGTTNSNATQNFNTFATAPKQYVNSMLTYQVQTSADFNGSLQLYESVDSSDSSCNATTGSWSISPQMIANNDGSLTSQSPYTTANTTNILFSNYINPQLGKCLKLTVSSISSTPLLGTINIVLLNNNTANISKTFSGETTDQTLFFLDYRNKEFSNSDLRKLSSSASLIPRSGNSFGVGLYFIPIKSSPLFFSFQQTNSASSPILITHSYSTDQRQTYDLTSKVNGIKTNNSIYTDNLNNYMYPNFNTFNNLRLFSSTTFNWIPAFNSSPNADGVSTPNASGTVAITVSETAVSYNALSTSTNNYQFPIADKPGPYSLTIVNPSQVITEAATNQVSLNSANLSSQTIIITPFSNKTIDNYSYYLEYDCKYDEDNIKNKTCPGSQITDYIRGIVGSTNKLLVPQSMTCIDNSNSCTGQQQIPFNIRAIAGSGKQFYLDKSDTNSLNNARATNSSVSYNMTYKIKPVNTSISFTTQPSVSGSFQIKNTNTLPTGIIVPDATIPAWGTNYYKCINDGIYCKIYHDGATGYIIEVDFSKISAAQRIVQLPISFDNPDKSLDGKFTDLSYIRFSPDPSTSASGGKVSINPGRLQNSAGVFIRSYMINFDLTSCAVGTSTYNSNGLITVKGGDYEKSGSNYSIEKEMESKYFYKIAKIRIKNIANTSCFKY